MDSDSEEDNIDEWGFDMLVMQQKCAAIQAIGDFANASPMKFAAYYKQTINVIDELYNHMAPSVKKLIIICYKHIVEATVKIVS